MLVVETGSPGGQAGSSSRIENYLGFPMGISGRSLAGRALAQAQKFGAQMMVARSAVRLNCDRRPYQVILDDGTPLPTRSIVLAAGAQYNKPPMPSSRSSRGRAFTTAPRTWKRSSAKMRSSSWWAAEIPRDKRRVLSRQRARFTCWCAPGKLANTMSRYLIRRIDEYPRLSCISTPEITGVDGNGPPGARQLARPRHRANPGAQHSPLLRHDRSVTAHGVA